ncbi:MAG: Sbal_3080 family lipoprotein [Arenicellales bacterium]|jgi:hypothetical protein|nr:Sbal_3080 family lipoprotein [Arenicellales bacterium]
MKRNTAVGKVGIVLLVCFLLTGCISRRVQPAAPQAIDLICIRENKDVLMEGFLPNLQEEIHRKKILTEVFSAAPPDYCVYTMTYTANWRWDLAMYLSYARIDLYKNRNPIGEVVFDASFAGLDLRKLASAQSKIDPLLAELLQNAR